MLRRIFSNVFRKKEDIPREYSPWLQELVPVAQGMLENIDKKKFNKAQNREARILLMLYVIGIVNYYQEANELTYGQYRFLTLRVLASVGWNVEIASYVFDRQNELSVYLPELAKDGEDAIDAGYRSGREYFEQGDLRAFLMPRFKEIQWKEKGWLKP